jgi:NADH:ubiquinone oxidoreductase subunit E
MSLPVLGKPRPSRPATHSPLELDRLMKLGIALEDAAEAAGTEQLSAELIAQVAADTGADESQLYAAAAMTTDLPFARTCEVAFVCCAGGCQGWGALDRIDDLLALQRARGAAGRRGFDVLARNCIDRCAQAPAVLVVTAAGQALITDATADKLAEAVAEVCDDQPTN